MYKIIGADQKEYGPVTADQIRQWIAEGRANGQTLICLDGTQDWRPLETFPEFGLAASAGAPTGAAPMTGPPATMDEVLARDYSLDIGECVSKSWELVKANMGPVVGISFLVLVAQFAINQALGLISKPAMDDMITNRHFSPGGFTLISGVMILQTPFSTVLLGGLFRYYLKLIRGQNADVGDAFSGFTNGFTQLALLGLVQGALVWIGVIFCIVPGIYLSVAWYFSTVLVADQGMDFWSAMEFSRKVVSKHWFLVFGFLLVIGLLAGAGVLACCIGMFVSAPVAFVAMALAYEDIFRRRQAA